jgi:hypothetical protein
MNRRLEGPGRDDGRDDADREHDDDATDRGIAEPEHREQRLRHLDDQPRQGDVGGAHSQDIASLEFRKQGHCSCYRLRFKRPMMSKPGDYVDSK